MSDPHVMLPLTSNTTLLIRSMTVEFVYVGHLLQIYTEPSNLKVLGEVQRSCNTCYHGYSVGPLYTHTAVTL